MAGKLKRPAYTRREDWPARLAKYFDATAAKRFSWPKFNCCTFAAGGIKAMTGDDPRVLFGIAYADEATALAALEKFAGGGVLEAAEKLGQACGFEKIPPAMAGRGDVVYCPEAPAGALGLVALDGQAGKFIHPADGPGRVAIAECTAAWRIV